MSLDDNIGSITMEEVTDARVPDWLRSHFVKQVLDPRRPEDGGPGKLLTIYATEASRRDSLSAIASSVEGAPIDRSLHHTLDSLVSALHAELRLPRAIPTSGVYHVILHEECSRAAKELAFPVSHCLPDMHWGRGKTRDLAALSSTLAEERVKEGFHPDFASFRRISRSLAERLGGIHPDDRLKEIVSLIEELPDNQPPFGLADIDGIVMLDHSPTLSAWRELLVVTLSRFRPLHVLAMRGSYRLGIHGFSPLDTPASKPGIIPEWLPDRGESSEDVEPDPIRVLVPRVERSTEAVQALIEEAFTSNEPPKSILIVDPRSNGVAGEWNRLLTSFGIVHETPATSVRASSTVHWISELTELGHGEDAWSRSRLRGIAVQQTLPLLSSWMSPSPHPSLEGLIPAADGDLLEEKGRGFHLLGGRGALRRWLWALSRSPEVNEYLDPEEFGRRSEATQWWLLCLASKLRPLLSVDDVRALDEKEFRIGCYSAHPLPIPESQDDGDSWLGDLVANLDWELMLSKLDGDREESLVGLRTLLDSRDTLRAQQETLGHTPPVSGSDWVEESRTLIESIKLVSEAPTSSSIRVLSPTDAHGVTADLVILTNLDTESWDTATPTPPMLSEEDRVDIGVVPHDRRLREARHAWNHLLHAGKEVILLDASHEDSSQPATPLAEWLTAQSWDPLQPPRLPSFLSDTEVLTLYGDESSRWSTHFVDGSGRFPISRPEAFVLSSDGDYQAMVTGRSDRDISQRSGIAIHSGRNPIRAPLNQDAPSISLDADLMKDRLVRIPTIGSIEKPYLDSSKVGQVVSVQGLRNLPTKYEPKVVAPRMAEEWPTIGLKLPKGKRALSVDPRPLSYDATKVKPHDRRNGLLEGPGRATRVWSPSRLTSWVKCPRQGWLSNRLDIDAEDEDEDDVDFRTQGLLIHSAYAELIAGSLGFDIGEQRSDISTRSLAQSGIEADTLSLEFLRIIAERAPWILRRDAIASVKRLDLTGLSADDYEGALDGKVDFTLSGRMGSLLFTELTQSNSCVLALEWPLSLPGRKDGVELKLPQEDEESCGSIRVRGNVDRVELVPVDADGCVVVESGLDEVCPLDIDLEGSWNHKRLVVIRDLKSVEGPASGKEGKRHQKELLEGVQLAIYARAWEVRNPGDRVIGVGITEVGESCGTYLEVDPDYASLVQSLEIGKVTSHTALVFRRPDENHEELQSNPFRAWMRNKLETAIRIEEASRSGIVVPTPEPNTCSYCKVKQACGLAPIVGGDKKWI